MILQYAWDVSFPSHPATATGCLANNLMHTTWTNTSKVAGEPWDQSLFLDGLLRSYVFLIGGHINDISNSVFSIAPGHRCAVPYNFNFDPRISISRWLVFPPHTVTGHGPHFNAYH